MNYFTHSQKNRPHQLFILSHQAKAYQQLFEQQALPQLQLTHDAKQADIVLADPPLVTNQLDTLSHLVWLQSTFAGVDALLQPQQRQDYLLTNIKGIFGQLISEYVLGYSLSHLRHFTRYQKQQQQQQWQAHGYQTVYGRKMVILGTGSIGNQLAQTASALGFVTLGVNRNGQAPHNNAFTHIYPIQQLHMALQGADIIVNTLPNTTQTENLLSCETFAHCQQALLFNVGRGNTLDENALLTALQKGQIEHAFLDVFRQEPLIDSSPLWSHPQITITPHIAATSFPQQVWKIFCDNYQRFIEQQPLLYQIDFKRGY